MNQLIKRNVLEAHLSVEQLADKLLHFLDVKFNEIMQLVENDLLVQSVNKPFTKERERRCRILEWFQKKFLYLIGRFKRNKKEAIRKHDLPQNHVCNQVCNQVYYVCAEMTKMWEDNIQVVKEKLFDTVSEEVQDVNTKNIVMQNIVYYSYLLPDPEKYILSLQQEYWGGGDKDVIKNILNELNDYLHGALKKVVFEQKNVYNTIINNLK